MSALAASSPRGQRNHIQWFIPDLDTCSELKSEEASYFQSLVGIMIWITELRQVKIEVFISQFSLSCQERGIWKQHDKFQHLYSKSISWGQPMVQYILKFIKVILKNVIGWNVLERPTSQSCWTFLIQVSGQLSNICSETANMHRTD